ncbi:MAG TPA: hypothetical protein VIK18_06560 [Pirellulales bacterium]
MPTELRWIQAPAVTGFYLAGLADETPIADRPLWQALSGPTRELRRACAALNLDFQRLVEHLIFYAADVPAHPLPPEALNHLTTAALSKAAGPEGATLAAALEPRVAAVVEALAAARPKLAEELELRSRPLAEQWEARGPGLLKQLARLTEPQALVPRAIVLPVYPLTGGGGRALPAYNTAVIEVVLANPRAELPEVTRLAWLLATLNSDRERYRAALADPRRVLPLAMVPAVLAAAAEVELARCEPASVQLAIGHWRLDENRPDEMAETLTAWWQTYLETRPSWTLALAALEQMIA